MTLPHTKPWHNPTPTPNLQTLTPALARAVGPALTLSRLGHALLDELEMVARAEDVEDSLASPNAALDRELHRPSGPASSGRARRLWAARHKDSQRGHNEARARGRWVATATPLGCGCSGGPPPLSRRDSSVRTDTIHGRLCDRPQAGDRLCFPPETIMGVRASLPPRRG